MVIASGVGTSSNSGTRFCTRHLTGVVEYGAISRGGSFGPRRFLGLEGIVTRLFPLIARGTRFAIFNSSTCLCGLGNGSRAEGMVIVSRRSMIRTANS